MRARLVTAVILAAASASLTAQTVGSARAGAPSRQPDLKTVLARAAAYVEEFRERLSGIVAEETYRQQEIPGERRELRSDLLLVRSETFPRWLHFRDTFEVDGQPVRDREERLTHLFFEPATALERAKRIATESSRYNIGPVERTINVPLMPLVFLERNVQPRFRFSRRADNERPAVPEHHAAHFRVSTEVWVVHFEERERPTIVRDSKNLRDVPSRGPILDRTYQRTRTDERDAGESSVAPCRHCSQLSIGASPRPPRTGRDVRAIREYAAGAASPPSQRWRRIEAIATYGKFRQFQVHVEQDVDLPRSPIDQPLTGPPAAVERPNDERPNDR